MPKSILAFAFVCFHLLGFAQSARVQSWQPDEFTSSNLPIVAIDTYGNTIPDEPKIPAGFKIYDNGPGKRNYLTDKPVFDGHIGIEIRGSSSQSFPKKSYGFESWDTLENSIDVSFLGMPAENDWILNANYSDKSLMRNVLAYQVWQNTGHYATRYHFVEVVLDGQYQGVYIFSEKIKRDKNRVNISKLSTNQNTGDELTGGYIFKIDKTTGSGGDGWVSSFAPPANLYRQIFYQYDYPKDVDITSQQKTYIQSAVNTFETVLDGNNFADTLNGFRKYADERSFIDYFFVNELSKNVDGYRLSTFINKDRDSKGGKISMGPVWDYDLGWGNADYYNGADLAGWAYEFSYSDDYWQVPFWWGRLLEDQRYKNNVACRWQDLRQNILSNAWFDHYIDSIAGQLNEAQARNFQKWPILGVYVWPNPWPYPTTYQGEVYALKSWVESRLNWLDENMPGTCDKTFGTNEIETNHAFSIYPNPVSNSLAIEYSTTVKTDVVISVVNPQGVQLSTSLSVIRSPGKWQEAFDVSSCKPGIYLLIVTMNGKPYTQRFIKI